LKQTIFENLCMKAMTGNISSRQQHQLERSLAASEDFQQKYDEMHAIWAGTAPAQTISIPRVDDAWIDLQAQLGLRAVRPASKTNPLHSLRSLFHHHWSWKPAMAAGLAFASVLAVLLIKQPDAPDNLWQTAETQNRQRTQLTLVDGSQVTLNSGSKLRFPRTFSSDVREVYLDGEGFFDVKSEGRPFIVLTDHAKTTVLGTRFNVRSRDDATRVMVESGRVRFEATDQSEDVILSAGQMSEIKISHSIPSPPEAIDIDVATGWMNGRVHFERTSIFEVILELERHYDVDIRYAGVDPNALTITGAFNDNSIETALTSICLTIDANFHLDGDTYIITK